MQRIQRDAAAGTRDAGADLAALPLLMIAEEDIAMIYRAKALYRLSTIAFVPFILLAGWEVLKP